MTKTILLCVIVTLMVAGSAWATDCSAYTNLSQYNTPSFSCTIGNLTFSNFSFLSTQDLSSVLVSPYMVGGDFGLEFNPELNGAAGREDVEVTYTITAPGALITSLDLSFNGFVSGEGGQAQVVETYCLNSSVLAPCPSPNSGEIAVVANGILNASVTFDGVNLITVSKDMMVEGPATISLVNNDVDLAPEPVTFGLIGLGLVGLAWARRFVRR